MQSVTFSDNKGPEMATPSHRTSMGGASSDSTVVRGTTSAITMTSNGNGNNAADRRLFMSASKRFRSNHNVKNVNNTNNTNNSITAAPAAPPTSPKPSNSNNNNNKPNTPTSDMFYYGDSSSDESDSTGNDNESSHSAHDSTVNETFITGREDTKRASVLRIIVLCLFIAMAVGAPIILFNTIQNSENDSYQRNFENMAGILLHQLDQEYEIQLGALRSLILQFEINDNNDDNDNWPFLTIPNFGSSVNALQQISTTLMVSILPFVSSANRMEWEIFVSDNTVDDILVSDQIFNANNPEAFVVDTTSGPYLPLWQSVPYIPELINFNNIADDEALALALRTSQILLGRVERHTDDSVLKDLYATHDIAFDEPIANVYVPILLQDNGVAAILASKLSFRSMFQHLLKDHEHSILIVVDNTCGDAFSYQYTNQAEIIFKGYHGQEDYANNGHDLELMLQWQTTADIVTTANNQEQQLPLQQYEEYCPYTIRILPTNEWKDSFLTTLPLTLALSLAAIVVFVSIMAAAYDYFVQRRMNNAVKSARESRAIVSSLFPAKVRDQLLQEEEQKNTVDEHFSYTQPLKRMSMSILGTTASVVGGSLYNNTAADPESNSRRRSNESNSRRRSNDSHSRRRSDDSHSRRRSNDSNSRRRSNDSNSRRRRSNDSEHRSTADSHKERRASHDRDSSLFTGVSDMFFSGAMAGFAALAPPKLRLKFVLHQDSSREAEARCDNDSESDELILPSKPIADLFPNCTVLFSDISGFTAWSSEREPEQVFTLLQTIFQSFDLLARRRSVYKVETIGDCYVAVTGCPDRQDDHAVRMTKFARACMHKVGQVTKKLETQLGPGTGDLSMRFGLNSGPVTAGVLRGEKSRFQLFGDTVNTAARMESTGQTNRIQISQQTADLLVQAGKANWIQERRDVVHAKGKGAIQTYWVLTARGPKEESLHDMSNKTSLRPRLSLQKYTDETSEEGSLASESGSVWGFDDEGTDGTMDSLTSQIALEYGRWIDWQVDLLAKLLKQLMVGRTRDVVNFVEHPADVVTRGETVVDEVSESINMPQFDPKVAKARVRPSIVKLSAEIMTELREYVTRIAALYRDANPFHNFAHASHVFMSAGKLLSRIVKPEDVNYNRSSVKAIASDLHDYTYGITSDPLTHFAVMFSALIHDVDHQGVSNAQLSKENPHMAHRYKLRSVAEQNSIDVAWDILMDPAFGNLQKCLFVDESELIRFRQMVVNMVISTDIFDKSGKEKQKGRWEKAFHPDNDDADLKASIVIESVIQAADVAHTMQHWQIYTKWNERLFCEMYNAYKSGRAEKDPSAGWYQGELWFFDNYIIPLARKLERCGIFGVSIDESLNYALDNRNEWAAKGKSIVKEMVERWEEVNQATTEGAPLLSTHSEPPPSPPVDGDVMHIPFSGIATSKTNDVRRIPVSTSKTNNDDDDDISIAFSDDSEEVDC